MLLTYKLPTDQITSNTLQNSGEIGINSTDRAYIINITTISIRIQVETLDLSSIATNGRDKK